MTGLANRIEAAEGPSALETLDLRRGREVDLTARVWGRNYEIMEVLDKGQRLRLATWSRERIVKGDRLILCNGAGTTRYLVEAVEHCGNPRDMAFVTASFAPRTRKDET